MLHQFFPRGWYCPIMVLDSWRRNVSWMFVWVFWPNLILCGRLLGKTLVWSLFFLQKTSNVQDLNACAWLHLFLQDMPWNKQCCFRKSMAVCVSQFVGTSAARYLENSSRDTRIYCSIFGFKLSFIGPAKSNWTQVRYYDDRSKGSYLGPGIVGNFLPSAQWFYESVGTRFYWLTLSLQLVPVGCSVLHW